MIRNPQKRFELFWAGTYFGRARLFAAPSALMFGMLAFARPEGYPNRVVAGFAAMIIGGLMFGAICAALPRFVVWKVWPQARTLSADDRRLVVYGFSRGEPIPARLEPVFGSFGAMLAATARKQMRYAWFGSLLAAAFLILLVISSILARRNDPAAAAMGLWFAGLWIAGVVGASRSLRWLHDRVVTVAVDDPRAP